MATAILIILDGVGVGGAPDAAAYGDAGSDTLGNMARATGGLDLPRLRALGLGNVHAVAGVPPVDHPQAAFGRLQEVSAGKDSTTGHWELMGLVTEEPFPTYPDGFPSEVLAEFTTRTGYGVLGNKAASGTEIIAELGDEHRATGKLIVYTSADSVFQIACHEDHFGLERLLALCKSAREVLDESDLTIGRVIARPFVGSSTTGFRRTENRHDYAVPPPAPTVLQRLCDEGGSVIGIGKIGDIFAHTGMSEEVRASGHPVLWDETFAALERAGDRSVVMTNFVDFDALYGHRRDVLGYGRALEEFDARLPDLYARLQPGDLLIIAADHGNDPTWPGTDHTREHIPILCRGGAVTAGRDFGARETFADIGQTIADYLALPAMPHGTSLFS